MVASASDEIWSNGSACGRRYRVTCIGATNDGAYPCNGNSVEVTIVDYCPSTSCPATMELSREAFGAIADLDAASSCYGNANKGTMIAAASNAIWDNRGACGRKYKVRCIGATNQGGYPCNGNSVVVTVVDYCPPSGCHATMDLSREAFRAIAKLDAGKIKISYTPV
ncbi:hypothetical protein HPP92_017048 [Vanilla planifolia]|uniref:Expansin-like EG45 domain-containing protein n=1 Tax=Vanilla planifolia TaxID=51239 RepID=A0A835UQN4_VANPL|nr:hypothetical protein HPP92_017048 [Vanilla planifolia]